MGEEQSTGEAAKPRKRTAAKPAARQAAAKLKLTIHLSVEAARKLDIHATMMSLDRSALVERLVHDNLKRWVVSDRGGDPAGNETAA